MNAALFAIRIIALNDTSIANKLECYIKQMEKSVPGLKPALSIAFKINSKASSLFDKDGAKIESVISYGNSEIPESKHFDDQMELYQNFKLKKVSMNKDEIYRDALRIYNPH